MDLFGLIVELFTNADHFLVSIATDYGTLIYIATVSYTHLTLPTKLEV